MEGSGIEQGNAVKIVVRLMEWEELFEMKGSVYRFLGQVGLQGLKEISNGFKTLEIYE